MLTQTKCEAYIVPGGRTILLSYMVSPCIAGFPKISLFMYRSSGVQVFEKPVRPCIEDFPKIGLFMYRRLLSKKGK